MKKRRVFRPRCLRIEREFGNGCMVALEIPPDNAGLTPKEAEEMVGLVREFADVLEASLTQAMRSALS